MNSHAQGDSAEKRWEILSNIFGRAVDENNTFANSVCVAAGDEGDDLERSE